MRPRRVQNQGKQRSRGEREARDRASNLTPRCPATGKIAFSTRRKALHAAEDAAHDGVRLRVYRCPHCGKHHVTSQEKKR